MGLQVGEEAVHPLYVDLVVGPPLEQLLRQRATSNISGMMAHIGTISITLTRNGSDTRTTLACTLTLTLSRNINITNTCQNTVVDAPHSALEVTLN